jgi:hypothetical protein
MRRPQRQWHPHPLGELPAGREDLAPDQRTRLDVNAVRRVEDPLGDLDGAIRDRGHVHRVTPRRIEPVGHSAVDDQPALTRVA